MNVVSYDLFVAVAQAAHALLPRGPSVGVQVSQAEGGAPGYLHRYRLGRIWPDQLYPAMVAPPEVDDPDLEQDDRDVIFTEGFKIAGGITREMVTYGRTRRDGDRRPGLQANNSGGADVSESHRLAQ